jgi:hypothetical protein
MPRTCTVCTHAQRRAIDQALIQRRPFRDIARQFGLSKDAAVRHHDEHLPALLVRAQGAKDAASADTLMLELRQCMERVNLLYDACDRWLRDPDDPTRYDIGPRAGDVNVIYSEAAGDRTVQRRAKLSMLLAKLEEANVDVHRVEWRHADPRELVLKTHGQLQSSLELLAKLAGQLDERPQLNVILAPEWQRVRRALLEALFPFPEARTAVAARLATLEAA